MPKCDEAIYGADETSFASKVANDALANPNSNMWSGNPIDNSAKSQSSSDKSLKLDVESEQATAKITKNGLGGDGRARTAGNHGKQG
jgi:hypothetical protein